MSTRTRPYAVLFACGLAVTTALTGCAGTDPIEETPSTTATTVVDVPALAASDPKAAVTLTWWTGQSADAQKTLEGLAAQFTKEHPNVTIKTTSGASTTDELIQKLAASFAAGTYPDITYAFGNWATELGLSGKTVNIAGSIKDPAVKWDEFSGGARATATVNGKIIGFPAVTGNLALLYNKSVFDKAGLPYPTDEISWDDFRATAKKLTNAATKTYGTAYDVSGGEGTTWAMWPLLWQNGGEILSADNKTAAFNSEAGVKSLQFWQDMAQTDKSVYLDQTADKAAGMFQQGTLGMMIGGPWFLWDLGQAKVEYGVTFLPGTNGDHQTIGGNDLWVLFDHGDANRAFWSYQFTQWLTSATQDEKWNIALGNLPLRSAEKDSKVFLDTDKVLPGFAHFADNLANAKKPRPTIKGYAGLSKVFGEQVSKILQGQATPKEGLDAAKQAADQELADSQ